MCSHYHRHLDRRSRGYHVVYHISESGNNRARVQVERCKLELFKIDLNF